MEDEAIRCLLEDNAREISLTGSQFLQDLLNDLIYNRLTSKYANIPVRSKIFEQYILPINGVVQCLFSAGFEEGEDSFYLPSSVAANRIQKLQEKLSFKVESFLKSSVFVCNKTIEKKEVPVIKNLEPQASSSATEAMDASFRAKILSHTNFVLVYEDPALQAKAQNVIPIDELRKKAVAHHSADRMPKNQNHIKQYLLLELLAWFKHTFFKWVDAEVCNKCNVPGRFRGTVHPTAEEQRWNANTVELLKCPSCNGAIRFPRYNHPGKLLETRKGRCGEWANCFTLCCRALGYEARFVVDWNDHVWTEVYSHHENRWLHCDPCENVCDKPLLYESGWGKKMTYVLAFSKDEVQDVTWRYSSFHGDVLKRRTLCSESKLLELVMMLTEQRQAELDQALKKELLMRKMKELVEFLSPKKGTEEDLGGRTSGSLEWRQDRGEVRSASSYCFTLTESEASKKMLHVTYTPVLNKYVRVTDGNSEMVGWQACTFESDSLFLKMENDWNMVYLARTEKTLKGSISWKFDFTASGLAVDLIQISCPVSTFENGQVIRTVSNGDKMVKLEADTKDIHEMQGSSWFLMKVELSGGKGPVAWQHAQLFRTSLSATIIPFSVKIFLKASSI